MWDKIKLKVNIEKFPFNLIFMAPENPSSIVTALSARKSDLMDREMVES